MQDQWLAEVHGAYEERDGYALADLLDPTTASEPLLQLRESLNSSPSLRSASYTSLTRSFFPEYRTFADFLASWLLFARDADVDSEDPARAASAYQLLDAVYRGADKVFSQGDTGWFVPTLRVLTTTLVELALKTGRLAGDAQLTKAGEAARMLGRPMGVASSDRNSESPTKRDALLFLANATLKIYFALSNLRLCDTVMKHTQNVNHILDTAYPKSDRAAFAYYRGRIFLYQRRLPQARAELTKAFSLCHAESWKNGRMILNYLIVASLALGSFPRDELLQEFDLSDQYENLLPALQIGDYTGVLAELERWQSWHLKKGNYLLLKEKLEVICWRNLARRTLYVATSGAPLPPTGPPTLSLPALLTAARMSFSDPELDIDDVESMCTSLMDQGYIKAYLVHSKKLLVLQKGPLVGFPPVFLVNP